VTSLRVVGYHIHYIKTTIKLQRRPQKGSFLQLRIVASGDRSILVGDADEE
jgi:hypothetical protein